MAGVKVSRIAPLSPTALSLFSGCGGFDLGFRDASFSIEAALDIDTLAIANYQANVTSHGMVWDLSKATLPRAYGSVDVLLAGSPCQGFSTIGKRDFSDPRNALLNATGEIARMLRPKVVVAENVPGALAGAHRKYWDTLAATLQAQGYQVQTVLLTASNFGIPQSRRRAFMLAWNTGVSIDVQAFLASQECPAPTLGELLREIKDDAQNHSPRHLPAGSTDFTISRMIRQGQKLCDVRDGETSVHTWEIPEVFGTTTSNERAILHRIMKLRRQRRVREFGDADPVPMQLLIEEFGLETTKEITALEKKRFIRLKDDLVDLKYTFNGKYRRLTDSGISFTVDTNFGNARYFLHPSEQRGFTVREAAKIQGFPDNYVFSGPERAQFKMIGNAVPPPLANAVAKLTRRLLGLNE
jgi:DNA (cytosine-5)-methyltransferase 1